MTHLPRASPVTDRVCPVGLVIYAARCPVGLGIYAASPRVCRDPDTARRTSN